MKPRLGSKIKAANAALLTRGEMEAVAEYFTADYVVRLAAGQDATGHAAIRRSLALLRQAFPKAEIEIEILVEHGDRVAWQRTFRGVQRGAFHGFPASGRTVNGHFDSAEESISVDPSGIPGQGQIYAVEPGALKQPTDSGNRCFGSQRTTSGNATVNAMVAKNTT
mgnify:CR=1 FL=1